MRYGNPNAEVLLHDNETIESGEVNATSHGTVRIQDYDTRRLIIDIDMIETPQSTLRDLKEAHVKGLQSRILENGFITSVSMLAVCPHLSEDLVIDSDNRITSKVLICDGRHRLAVFRAIRDNELLRSQWEEKLSSMPVNLWVRRDEERINHIDLLAISALLNHATSTVTSMSFYDRVYAAISVCETLKRDGFNVEAMSIATLASILARGGIVGDVGERVRLRYAHIAARMFACSAMRNKLFSGMKTLPLLGLSHVSCNVFLNTTDPTFFGLCLDVLMKRLSIPQPVTFETIRTDFFATISDLYKKTKNLAAEKDVSVEVLLKETFPLTNETRISLSDFIANKMLRYAPTKDSEKARATRTRLVGDKVSEILHILKPTPPPSEVEVGNSGNRGGNGDRNHNRDDEEEEVPRNNGNRGGTSEVKRPCGDTDTGDVIMVGQGNRSSSRVNMKKRQLAELKRQQEEELGDKDDTPYQPPSQKKRNTAQYGAQRGSYQVVKVLKEMQPRRALEVLRMAGFEAKPMEAPASDGEESEEEPLPFDDEIPAETPHGYMEITSRPPLQRNASWLKHASWPPSWWPIDRNPIEEVHSYLRYVHIPDQHRAHILLNDKEVLRRNHHQVFWTVLRSGLSAKFWESAEYKKVDGSHGTRYEGLTEVDKGLVCIRRLTEQAGAIFSLEAERLKKEGHAIFPGLFKDLKSGGALVTDGSDSYATGAADSVVGDPRWFDKVMGHFQNRFERFKQDGGTEFAYIRNQSEEIDEEEAEQGRGRYQSSRAAVMEKIEDEGNIHIARGRAIIDVRIGQVLRAMKIAESHNENGEMFMPSTGGRFLVTTPGAKAQLIHTDRGSMTQKDLLQDRNPGYYALVTGRKHAYLNVVPHLHRTMALDNYKHIRALSSSTTANPLYIPPYSLVMGRGDQWHGGYQFLEECGTRLNIRYHVYILPTEQRPTNAIQLLKDFQPTILPKDFLNNQTESESSRNSSDSGSGSGSESGSESESSNETDSVSSGE